MKKMRRTIYVFGLGVENLATVVCADQNWEGFWILMDACFSDSD